MCYAKKNVKNYTEETMRKNICQFFFILLALLMLQVYLSEAASMALPASQQFFEYVSVAQPDTNSDPANAKPVAIGSIADGTGSTFNLKAGTASFSAPVDIYFLVYAPSSYIFYGSPVVNSSNPLSNFFVLLPDKTFQSFLTGFKPWKQNVTAALNEEIFGNVPTFFLAQGSSYYLYLFVTPTGSFDTYYLWATTFTVPSVYACMSNMGCPVTAFAPTN